MPTKINQADMQSATASEAIGANLLVEPNSTGVGLCAAGKKPCGVTQEGFASNAQCNFYTAGFGTALVTASAAIAAGDHVKAAASGKVAPETDVAVPTALTIGRAKGAASGDGVTFEMYWS